VSPSSLRIFTLSRAALVLIGFTATVAQIVLMREMIVVFYGNEISLGIVLANWLVWTAFGSGVLGRWAGRARNPRRVMACLQVLIAAVFPLTLLMLRASKRAFLATPGEILGPVPMFVTSLVVLCLFCSLSGLLFAVGSRFYSHEAATEAVAAISTMYCLEALGAGIGGLLASLALVRYFTAFDIASLVSLLNLLAAVSLAVERQRLRRVVLGALIAVFAIFVFPFLDNQLEKASQAWLWHGFQVVATRTSVYGNLAVTQTGGTHSLFENGLIISSAPDLAAAEEAVHFALLQHPAPKSLLLVGGGLNGSLAQALQHPTLERIDYVELDPAILDLAQNYFAAEWTPVRNDPRVRLHPVDGRLFLKTTRESFDVIILNLPDPETAQLNRFYTLEFFREVAARLAPTGVFSFQLRAAEDYISPELADFLRCIRKTLGEVFPEVTAIPGGTVHFFAAQRPGILATGPQDLLARLRSRHLQPRYVREYYIPFRMSPDRMMDLDSQIQPRADTPVNHDFAPIAYYFDVALWSRRFNSSYRQVFRLVAAVPFRSLAGATALVFLGLTAAFRWMRRKAQRLRSCAGYCVAATGFTLMGLEILLLLGFQAIYGYVYHQLAILIAAFMVGMALGSWWALGHRDSKFENRNSMPEAGGSKLKAVKLKGPDQIGTLRHLAGIQILVAVSPLLLYALLEEFSKVRNAAGLFLVSQIVFPVLAVLCGLLGGYQFPVANRVFFLGAEQGSLSPGTLYALDLAGACVGAVVLSVYLVPVFGFLNTSLLIAVVSLAPAGLAFLSTAKPSPRGS
jgi:spermidine synthase